MEISLNGTVYKYTNFVYGYQERYFKLSNGTLYYYLSKETEHEGCRKFRVLSNFKIQYDDDPCHLDVIFRDDKWSLRFRNREEFLLWNNAFQALLIDKSEKPIATLISPCLLVSPETPDAANSTISTKGHRKTFTTKRDVHTINKLRHEIPEKLTVVLMVLEKITLAMSKNDVKAKNVDLSDSIELAISYCSQLKRDVEHIRQILGIISDEMTVNDVNEIADVKSDINNRNRAAAETDDDEEWVDATDKVMAQNEADSFNSFKRNGDVVADPIAAVKMTKHDLMTATVRKQLAQWFDLDAKDPLIVEIEQISVEQLENALKSASDQASATNDGDWELFVKDGQLKMYRMDHEMGGIACDPLKAIHCVDGVSAREYINLFFDPELKMEWDDTLVKMNKVKTFSPNTAILHQIHRRIWPSAQRESLFWSQKLDVSEHRDSDAIDAHMVVNHDTEAVNVPLSDSSCVRVKLKIAMLCQTVLINGVKGPPQLRKEIGCRIIYVAQVHPGGWVPVAALRQIYKREYPKFLRQFTEYVRNKVKDTELKL